MAPSPPSLFFRGSRPAPEIAQYGVLSVGSILENGSWNKEIFDALLTDPAFLPVPAGGAFMIVPDDTIFRRTVWRITGPRRRT